jgi:hypothetical protein
MPALLFKDVTAAGVHAETALGNDRARPRKPDDAGDNDSDFETNVDVVKVDESHGLVLGFAIICKRDGADYVDLQGDVIPEDAMLAAAVDFMSNARMAKEMHAGEQKGIILFAMPLTTDIAKAFGIETKTTGLMIAMQPNDAAILAKFRSGEYSGFSIGGKIIASEDVAG